MATLYKFLAALLLLSIVSARPTDSSPEDLLDLDSPLASASSSNVDPFENPRLYLIVAEADGEGEAEADLQSIDERVEKRSAEENDDLEAAAGTNVLRPLFVYRQQLAYRERVKKGASRRLGFRPRF